MVKKEDFIESVVKVIAKNYGDTVANGYKQFYADKNEKVILQSCKALLAELVGPANADKQMAELHKKVKTVGG